MPQTDFRPLSFRQVRHEDLRPPMFDGDHTRGYDYCIGDLVSLLHAPGAIRFTVAFRPGPDARADGPPLNGEAEFFVMRAGKYLIGHIHRQVPERFFFTMAQDQLQRLDGLGTGSGIGNRAAAHFSCVVPGYAHGVGVSAYFRKGLFGGWKEIIIETPKKTLYAAYP